MSRSPLGVERSHAQWVAAPGSDRPGEVVARLGAVQAQDYLGSLWALGLRTRSQSERDVERAIEEGAIVRTWPMRGTLHYLARQDIHWMLDLLTGRRDGSRSSRHRELGLDDRIFARCRKVAVKALEGGRRLARPALFALFERAGISVAESRGLHILGQLATDRLICFGPREGRQPTLTLLDEWVPRTGTKTREEALAVLATRYFTSHGPATAADFAWWSGLTLREAREGAELAGSALRSESVGGAVQWSGAEPSGGRARFPAVLLPPFDEFVVAYRDRSGVVDPAQYRQVNAGGGMLRPTILIGGRVVGTWTRTLGKDTVSVVPAPFGRLGPADRRAVEAAARRYGRFLGLEPVIAW